MHSSDIGIPCDLGSKNLLLKKKYFKKMLAILGHIK